MIKRWRITLMPPAVDPAQPPKNKNGQERRPVGKVGRNKACSGNDRQYLKQGMSKGTLRFPPNHGMVIGNGNMRLEIYDQGGNYGERDNKSRIKPDFLIP
jgi:hypothetical protein